MQIAKNIYSVGILNPNLRVFDIIMKTDYGTSYNSYLIKDSKGNILIDTVHNAYTDIFFNNIKEISSMHDVKYLVVNHCEPDHSGAIKKLIEINPNILIFCSKASSIFLKEITNFDNLNIHVVEENEEIKFNEHTLKFLIAPFLHWPDSMFTYLINENILFTCDFLGSHYCEPTMQDYYITYHDAYENAFKNYYDAIFDPFKTYVLNGLEKVRKLSPKVVCPSHGPILHNGCLLSKNIKQYYEWSNIKQDEKLFPIFYVSAYHNTELVADQIAKSAEKFGFNSQKYNVIEYSIPELANILNSAKYFAIGSPTINRNALPPIWNLLSNIDAINMKKSKALLFGSYGWSGEAIPLLDKYLTSLGIDVFPQSIKINFVPNEQNVNEINKIVGEFLK